MASGGGTSGGNISHIQDERFEYQVRLAELKSVEREMLTARRSDKDRYRGLKKQFEEIGNQLYDLSHHIKHK
jgi:hypothetical protein